MNYTRQTARQAYCPLREGRGEQSAHIHKIGDYAAFVSEGSVAAGGGGALPESAVAGGPLLAGTAEGRGREAMVEAAAVRIQAWFRRALGRWEATDRSFDDVPAWLEERIEAGDMLEEAGCELAGWPLDPAEQDPLVPLRPLVVAGGLTVAVNGIVRI